MMGRMSTQDPRGESQTPEELLAETDSVLGDEAPTTGETREGEPQQQTQPPAPGSTDELTSTKGGTGRSAGTWSSLIIGAVIVVRLLIFIVQHNVATQLRHLSVQ